MERGLTFRGFVRYAGALALVGATFATPQGYREVDREIVVVSPSNLDPRVTMFREAVAFWNDVLADLDRETRLVESSLLAPSPHERTLENYTRAIWQQAGRIRRGASRPAEPVELTSLGGDVVMFFSQQPTMSFAWPLEHAERYFVAIPVESGARMSRTGVTRNVIAHELGHTLGLIHHANPIVLMCSPCSPSVDATDRNGFLPLTEIDRLRLRELLPSR